MKRTKTRFLGLLLATLMLLSFAAFGKDHPEQSSVSEAAEPTPSSVEEVAGTTINATLFDLTYDEADGWVYEEDDFYDYDD